MVRRVRFAHLANIFDAHIVMMQTAARAMVNREKLHRRCMPVLETTIGQALPLQSPAAHDRGKGIWRRPAALLHTIERERSRLLRYDRGKFLDLKIVRLLFEFHVAFCSGAAARRRRTRVL